MAKSALLYFHSPCFDGIVSAVIASDFLEAHYRWNFERFCAVDYNDRACWLSRELHSPCAVVDFIYHPQATFWADHHSTTFLTADAKRDYDRRRNAPTIFYNDRMGSCSKLLWHQLKDRFDYRNQVYSDIVEWAEKIDSARYSSVTEAVFGDAPALRIRASLGVNPEPEFFDRLIGELRVKPLEEVASLPQVEIRASELRSQVQEGLARLKNNIRIDDNGIVSFDVDSAGVAISRYAPYLFFPDGRYSAGVVRSSAGAKITAMRNPWRDFPSVNLGKIFERFGGGGHERVGAVLVPDAEEAAATLDGIIDEIRREDAGPQLRTGTV